MDSSLTPSSPQGKKRPVVHLSPVRWRDAPDIAKIYLQSFAQNPHLPIVSPEYAGLSIDDLLRVGVPSETRMIRERLVGPDIAIKASIFSTNEHGRTLETIIGYAGWTPDRPRRRTFWEWLLSTIIYPIYNFLRPIQVPLRIPPGFQELMSEQRDKTFGKGAKWEGRRYWYLHYLCVPPEWQGVGVGSSLLQWGFDKARQNDSVVYLESSPMGVPFYIAKGFEIAASAPRDVCGSRIEAPGMLWVPRMNESK